MKKSREELQIEKREKRSFPKSAKNKRDTVVELTKAALFAAIFCVLAPHTLYLPLGPVGITFGSLLLYLTGLLLGARLGCISVFLYLCMGLLGLPVFSGYTAGAGVLFGPTGGFLFGYLPCVGIIGAMGAGSGKGKKGVIRFLMAMLAGTVVLYGCGVLWFAFGYGGAASVGDAITVCVLPFLPFDAVKIGFMLVVYKPFRRIRALC